MPQLVAITLADRETTPVNHILSPRGKEGDVAVVAESSATPLGETTLRLSIKRQPTGRAKIRLVLVVPVVQTETINGVSSPKVVRTAAAYLDVVFDETSTLQERKNLVGMLASSLGASQVLTDSVLTKLESIW